MLSLYCTCYITICQVKSVEEEDQKKQARKSLYNGVVHNNFKCIWHRLKLTVRPPPISRDKLFLLGVMKVDKNVYAQNLDVCNQFCIET